MAFEFQGALACIQHGYFIWKSVTNPFPLEVGYWLVVLLVAAVLYWRPGPFARLERGLYAIARRRVLSVVLVGIAAVAIRSALLPIIPVPTPYVHDEFSYLLQADTFASGRLTNPAHPLWVFFESFHINVLPTYQSMYPPAQAIFLATAQKLTGVPWLGVLTTVALMSAAVCWMLQPWMPPPWPLLGGLFCVMRYAIFGYYVNSYFGGAVAGLGGALVLGAAGRLRRKLTVGNGVILAVGLILLANSRPYEGLIFSIPVLIALPIWTRRFAFLDFCRRVALPAALLLAVAGAGMLYYNWRGTGHALLMPYRLNQSQYHITNSFMWERKNPTPAYNHADMKRFYSMHEVVPYLILKDGFDGFQVLEELKFRDYYSFFIWPLLFLLIPTCWQMVKNPKQRIFPIVLLTVLAGLLVILWNPMPQYPAPVIGVIVAVMLSGLRLLRTWKPRGMEAGVAISRAIVLTMFIWMAILAGRLALNPYQLNDLWPDMPHSIERARVEAQIRKTPGKHLLFVKIHGNHYPYYEWVYNDANIDQERVVWARDMGPERNRRAIEYFHDRRVWIVDQDDGISRPVEYPREAKAPAMLLAGKGGSH